MATKRGTALGEASHAERSPRREGEAARPATPAEGGRRLLPLVAAAMASQALLVVLAPTLIAVAGDFSTSAGVVSQARSVTAAAAIAASVAIAALIDRAGVRPLLVVGAALGIAASAALAAAPSLPFFLAAHVLTGVAFACLLSAAFAGVAGFTREHGAWAMGWVVGAQGLAWVVANPLVGLLTDVVSWRAAQAVPAAIALGVLAASAYGVPARAADPGPGGRGMRAVVADRSARRWVLAELAAYFAWGAELTFVGAFFIERHGVGEAAAGVLLALGAAVFFVTSVRSGPLVRHVARRPRVVGAAIAMAAAIALQLNVAPSVAVTFGLFCLVAVAAGARTPASGALGLAQLPTRPGAMMTARTAATQLGYLLGALAGGGVLAWAGYGALGLVLAAGMLVSAVLTVYVTDPLEDAPGRQPRAAPPDPAPVASPRWRSRSHERAPILSRDRRGLRPGLAAKAPHAPILTLAAQHRPPHHQRGDGAQREQ